MLQSNHHRLLVRFTGRLLARSTGRLLVQFTGRLLVRFTGRTILTLLGQRVPDIPSVRYFKWGCLALSHHSQACAYNPGTSLLGRFVALR